jgi:hypothetical protein
MRDDIDSDTASIEVQTPSGDKFDINNISGKRKALLVMEGQIKADAFVAPPNVGGKKLRQLRESHNQNIENRIAEMNDSTDNPYKIGNLVEHKGVVLEVQKIHPEKGVLLPKAEGGKMWVHHTKVKLADLSKDD